MSSAHFNQVCPKCSTVVHYFLLSIRDDDARKDNVCIEIRKAELIERGTLILLDSESECA
jgi:hypothetical protein